MGHPILGNRGRTTGVHRSKALARNDRILGVMATARLEGNGSVVLKLCCSRGIGKRSINLALLAIVAGITCLLAACGENGVMSRFMLKPDRIIVERRADPAYDKLFPYYVELCATSQVRSKLKVAGRIAGHAG